MIEGENIVNFNIEVDVETGERLFRPLQFIKDKGNDFQIKAMITYYKYEIEEPMNDNNNDDDDDKTTNDDGSNIGLGEFYRNLCYGKAMI